jgi:hypothetical protein
MDRTDAKGRDTEASISSRRDCVAMQETARPPLLLLCLLQTFDRLAQSILNDVDSIDV